MKGIGLKIGIIFIFWGVFDILLSCFQDNLGSNMFWALIIATLKSKESVWAHFLNLLNRPDGFIQNMTARIVAKMACWSPPGELMAGSDLQFYLTWLKDQLRMQNNEYVQSVARCLQMMLRIDDYRLGLNKTQFALEFTS